MTTTCTCGHAWADHNLAADGNRDCRVPGCTCRRMAAPGLPTLDELEARGWTVIRGTGKGYGLPARPRES